MSAFWTWVGFVLTAFGTGIAIWQAIVAKKAASEAKSFRDEIVTDRLRMSLIDLSNLGKHAREECKKIITPVGKPLRGIDYQKVINLIQDFHDKANELSFQIEVVEYKEYTMEIGRLLSLYKATDDPIQRFKVGDCIYSSLNGVIGLISKKIHEEI